MSKLCTVKLYASGGLYHTGYGIQQSSLAGSVGTDKTYDLAVLNLHVDAL